MNREWTRMLASIAVRRTGVHSRSLKDRIDSGTCGRLDFESLLRLLRYGQPVGHGRGEGLN